MSILTRSPIVVATLVVIVMLCALTGGMLIHHNEMKSTTLSMLRTQVRDLAISASLMVDGDLLEEVERIGRKDSPEYRAAVAPLVRLHNAIPDTFYVYTMVEKAGRAYFVLDTAGQPDLRSKRNLKPSGLMEPFEEVGSDDGWLKDLAAGRVYTTPDFETDDYGTFLSGHAPIYDSRNKIVGFSGIDVDVDYILAWQKHLNHTYVVAYVLAVATTCAIGYLVFVFLQALRRKADVMEDVSLHDALTGVYNRRAFELRQESDFARFRRNGDSVSLVMIDIDFFKRVNDTYGHENGDLVLKALARTILRQLRESDFFARWGGEEFVIILNDTAPDAAAIFVERLRAGISETPITLADGQVIHINVSMGVSAFRDGDMQASSALTRADEALYEAKQTGRNRVVLK